MRFFHKGLELQRRHDWRLSAWPNPWEVQLAFDGSLSTRWRTWETARPGDYLDVDFGRDEEMDEVQVDTSPDFGILHLQVEVLDSTGKWIRLAKDPSVTTVDQSKYSFRMAATHEMKAHGLYYLLIGDDYAGASDFRDDPGAWGLTVAASGYGVKLYKVAE